MFKNIVLWMLVAGIAGGGYGCFFEPYRETAIFDFPGSGSAVEGASFQVEDFLNNSSANCRMQFKMPDGAIRVDGYSRWVLPPGALVSRRLSELLSGKPPLGMRVSGSVTMFEVDCARGEFCLSGTFYFDRKGMVYPYSIRIALKSQNAPSIAAAAGQAVDQLAAMIAHAGGNRQ